MMQQRRSQWLELLDDLLAVGAMAPMVVVMAAMAMVEVMKAAMAVAREIMIQHGGGNITVAILITTAKLVAAEASHVW